ncbi:hypothetical protein [Vibrio gazogenes]|uniref:Uncharacterized protein n=1 Tax=Vibrio gazogenes TaxID=687 RepID=A0A1Z2SEM8_VIBGA|nr:hypothetical protein [Vibrio gazogenes]ASA55640.1 hypothetical protein BSQ33_07970 [Vibrio gazogenes]
MSYQPTAYNSQTFTPQPNPREKQSWSERMHKRGEVFPFSQVNDCIATSAVRTPKPSVLNSEVGVDDFWTHQQMQPYTFVRWAGIYMFLAGLAKFVLMFIYPMAVLATIAMLIYGEADPKGILYFFIETTIYLAVIPLLLYSPILWINWRNPKVDKTNLSLFARKKHCLNRETGMVTLYGEHNRKIFSHPFIEFDCILASNPNHQGLLSYRLMLVHRYSDYAQGVNIGSLVGVNAPLAEYRRLWNMIQQYMDVSKPLPDIPMLEQFRELDPTTAAYDQQHQRNPNYWRSMSDEEFDKTLTEMARNQREQNIPPTGPEIDIFAKA